MTKLLIVDDNAEMRQLVKSIVKKVSDVVFECEDGAEALAAYTTFRPDWVLMDWEMKRVDGLTATRRIRAEFPDARILFVTQYDNRELRHAAREAGACGYVLKENLLELRQLLI